MDKESKIISYFSHALNGDDGAVCGQFVYSKDLFIENVHFKRTWLSMGQIGSKAVLVNISDAIAMNATPLYALLGLALPKSLANDDIKALCEAIKNECESFGVSIIGGDTTSSDKIIISLTIISKVNGKALLRTGAKNGDFVAFTGVLGGSNKGLKALMRGAKLAKNSRFVRPSLRREFVFEVANFLRCGMDISDGLLNDLPKLIKGKNIKLRAKFSKQIWQSGEEYEMLVCIKKSHLQRVLSIAKKTRTKITILGQVKNGYLKLPKYRAFKHF